MTFSFEEYLKKKNLSQNTIKAYLFTVKQYQSKYMLINKKNLQAYKTLWNTIICKHLSKHF